ncbi:MAG: type I-E CRISPR-associated protein Cas7/Cse4/CasC [Proteobacteria bacterium]|nr:type I-E CRISPR-associated protein Cas7/Cse4/CasC [Pseudomonadota bacterium]
MQARQIGIHVLTAYPPSNPNRDENGQPKTAIVNGIRRQRISSQCIKRAWRLSEIMKAVEGQFSVRTCQIGELAFNTKANQYASAIASCFGSIDKKKGNRINSEMVVLGHEEVENVLNLSRDLRANVPTEATSAIHALLAEAEKSKSKASDSENGGDSVNQPDDGKKKKLAKEDKVGKLRDALKVHLEHTTTSVDVAMFGRMRAAAAKFNVDASIYVAHPLTTGKATLDADFWTSVDDLKSADEDADGGAGGMGEVEFGSGTYYTYVQVNRDALAKNLDGNEKLANEVITKLVEAIANVSPSGHKTTFGNEVRASYLRVEVGQPSGNLYCKAFEEPINGTAKAIKALRDAAEAEAVAYGLQQKTFEFSPSVSPPPVNPPSETLASVLDGVAKALEPQ